MDAYAAMLPQTTMSYFVVSLCRSQSIPKNVKKKILLAKMTIHRVYPSHMCIPVIALKGMKSAAIVVAKFARVCLHIVKGIKAIWSSPACMAPNSRGGVKRWTSRFNL